MRLKNYLKKTVWAVLFFIFFSGSFTNVSSADTNLIQPQNIQYRGAFKLPDVSAGSDWSYSGNGMTYYPDGDPNGPSDGYPGSLYAVGHDQDQMLSEISIPVPVISSLKDPGALNTATTLQPFTDIRSSLFGYMDLPSPGLAYLPAQGAQLTDKIHFSWSQWIQTGEPTHGWLELDLSNPQIAGPWFFGNYSNYLTNDFLFEIPEKWAEQNTPGLRLVSGRFREGQWSGYGPSLFAYGPWNDGNPPAADSKLTNITLLLSYGSDLENSEVTVDSSRAMNNYQLSDTFAGGAWLTSGNHSAIILSGTKATGRSWYGYGNGVEYPYLDVDENTIYPEVPDWPFDERGFWSEGIEAQLIFYNPDDLAKVTKKSMEAYEPQPYAVMTLDSYLFDGSSIDYERAKKHLLGAMAFDRANGLIYVMERRADEEKSLVHVFKINLGQNLYFSDNDQDGYGDPNSPLEDSSQPSGYVTDNTDCNDNESSIHPGATEICDDAIDQDCDGSDKVCGINNDADLKAVIKTEEVGDITAVWQKGGEDTTSRGDRVVWGYFYASPSDVSWGSINNPEVFVKVWYDAGGRIDVNFFHVSVPDIEVSATYNGVNLEATATTFKRYIRHYYNDNNSDGTSENTEDGIPVAGYNPSNNPYSYSTINNLKIGAMINTVEAIGSIDALWTLGGQDTTGRGDQVVWGHFYADPNKVSWGSRNNPELFVKIWFDAGGRIDVNYFHVSVPDIEVYSDYGSDGIYDNKGTTIMDDRYIRHEYTKQ